MMTSFFKFHMFVITVSFILRFLIFSNFMRNYMEKGSFWGIFFLLSMSVGLMSCRQDEEVTVDRNWISFHSEVDGMEWQKGIGHADAQENAGKASRGRLVYTSSMYSRLGCWASMYDASETWNEQSPINLMDNHEISQESSYTSSAYWPGARKKVRFFAYAPYGSTSVSFPGSRSGYPVFDYTVPLDVAAQEDILVASTTEYPGDFNQVVPLKFKHALTAIRFVDMGMPQGTVTKITVSGVYGKARHYVGKDVWDNYAATTDFVYPVNYQTASMENANVEIQKDNNRLILLPQVLPQGAELKLELRDPTGTVTEYTASLANTEWQMGKIVRYNLSIEERALVVVGDLSDWMDGGEL